MHSNNLNLVFIQNILEIKFLILMVSLQKYQNFDFFYKKNITNNLILIIK